MNALAARSWLWINPEPGALACSRCSDSRVQCSNGGESVNTLYCLNAWNRLVEHLFIFCEFLESEGREGVRERHLFKPGFSPSYTALVIIHKFIGDPCTVYCIFCKERC